MYLADHAIPSTQDAFRPAEQCTITPIPGGRHQIKLTGKFPPRWLANLAGGLSAHGISILSGYANKLSPTVWQATFEIMPMTGCTLTDNLDYLAMVMHGTAVTAEAQLILESFTVRPAEGSLYVEILGEDTVGFLLTILRTFAFYSLHPAEISVATPGGRVHDRFWLKGLGGVVPNEAIAEVLREVLSRHIVSPRS